MAKRTIKLLSVQVVPNVAVLDEDGEVEATLNVQMALIPAKEWNKGWTLDVASMQKQVLAQIDAQSGTQVIQASEDTEGTPVSRQVRRQAQRKSTPKKKVPAPLRAVKG